MVDLPRKVLHVLNSAGGGAALSTIGLIEALRPHGVAACAVCDDLGTDDERQRLREAVNGEVLFIPLYWWNRKIRSPRWKRPLIELRQWARGRFAGRSAHAIAKFAGRHHADMVHTNTILTPEGGLAARRLGLPHVWHLREMVGPGHPFRLPVEGPPLGHYLHNHANKVIANSSASAACISAWLPAGLLEIVVNGIDIGRFRPRADAADGRKLVVAMVGSLTSRWKNHALFVEAAALVDRSLPIEFRIYGHDPSQGGRAPGDDYTNALHAKIREHGLTDRFVWPGFVADPVAIMREIDVMLHPTADESFGRVIVEAMAAELPVVGVRGGGAGEIVLHEETGLLAAPGDAAGLAAAVERLAREPALRRQMGLAGQARAASCYSLEACALRVLDVYRAAMRPVRASA